jgi:GABA(A) receptor-associated protein
MAFRKKEEFDFDKKVTLEKRKEEVEKQLKNHPGKIPIVIQQSKSSKLTLPESFKFKFLVPPEQTFGSFVFEIRKRINLKPEQALFVFVNDAIPPSSHTMEEVYNKYKDEDGFLKLLFCEENVFGNF